MSDGALIVSYQALVAAAVALGLLVVALAWPLPVLLARAGWPMRAPVVALVVWQLIGLAGGLSMITWLALLGLLIVGTWWGVLPAVAFAAYLLVHLGITTVQVTRQRHRHLALLEMLTSPHPTRTRIRVLDHHVPVAYCLPKGVGSVTVLSQGLLDRLDPDELVAVIAHERAHVEQRHDILLLAFRAWRTALGRFPIAVRAEAEVVELVEMLADDHARREVRDEVLARAILRVGAGGDRPEQQAMGRHSDRFRRLVG